jgi:DNA replication protein DnaC
MVSIFGAKTTIGQGATITPDSGTGKSHIALGLGSAACRKGLSVGFTTAPALVHELIEARDERPLVRLQRRT